MKHNILIIILLLASGCNPHLTAPSINIPDQYVYSKQCDSLKADEYQSSPWWEKFCDTTLNRLITTALQENNDILAAASKVRQAEFALKQMRSQYLPSFDFGREVGISGTPSFTQYYSIEPSVSWEIPLFGSLRAATTQAAANIEYAEWQYRGVRLAIAAQVATTYYNLLQYRRDLHLAIESSRLRRETATLTDSLFVRGLATGLHRQQALSLLYTAEADIPLYEQQVRQAAITLNALIGAPQSDTTIYKQLEINAINSLPTIDIPVGIPSDILYRRADVASSYAELIITATKAKQARIARLPTLQLTTEGGVISDQISTLFKSDSWAWSVLLGFSQPVFRFGALKSAEKQAVEQYNESLYNYHQSFITALSEVEESLSEITTTREQSERYKSLVEANQRIATLSVALYRNGLSSYLDVIDAERNLYDSQMNYSNIICQHYLAYIKLCKALGA